MVLTSTQSGTTIVPYLCSFSRLCFGRGQQYHLNVNTRIYFANFSPFILMHIEVVFDCISTNARLPFNFTGRYQFNRII